MRINENNFNKMSHKPILQKIPAAIVFDNFPKKRNTCQKDMNHMKCECIRLF